MQGSEESLLQLPHAQHQSHAASVKPDHALRPGALQMHIDYHETMKEGLKNLGLYQMVEVHHCQVDRELITALVERWRPETNRKTISGCTDDNWSQLILDCLGQEVYDGYEWDDNDFYHKKVENKGEPNEKVTILQNYVRLAWLRKNFANTDLDEVEDQDVIDQHTRAYAMELFGTIMFPDSNSSSVRLMYLQFLEDLGPRGENYYNWGGAMWSWTRFPIGRPRPHDLPSNNEPVDERRAYGAKWTIPHRWKSNPKKGTSHYRDQFERLKSNVVNWTPYRGYENIMHWHWIRDQAFFPCRVWCIHFWEVEYHLPERVFRQFGLFQAIPPPAPPAFSLLEDIRKWTRG
ncbi:serine/threonine-protein phosphatase 7 long form homolog [Carex rostrata]